MTTETRTRSKNPYTTYKNAKAYADRARKASLRADDLAEKAQAAADRAATLRDAKASAEVAEQEAWDDLQAALAGLDTDTDAVADTDE